MMTTVRDRFILFAIISYTTLGLAWILLSDQLLRVFVDIGAMVWLSTAKGVFFVIATAALFFIALRAVPPANATGKETALEALAAGITLGKHSRPPMYLFAIVITLAMLLVRNSIAVQFDNRLMLILFMFPIILSALLGGIGPGLMSTAIAALGVDYLVIPPVHSFRINASNDQIQWCFLIVNGVAVSLLSEIMLKSLATAQINRRLLDTVISGTSDAIFIKDDQGRYLLINEAAAEFVGKTPDEIIDHDDSFLFPEISAREVMANDQAIMSSGRTCTHEEQITPFSGNTRTFLVTKGPVLDQNGRVIGLFGVAHDITERMQAEERLRVSEERLRLALDASRDGLWDWDLRNGEVYRSLRYYELTGRQANQDISGFEFFKTTVHPDDLPRVLQTIEEHKQGKTPAIEFEYRLLTRSEEIKWMSVRGLAVERNAEGAALRIVGTLADITERKQAEAELRIAAVAFESSESMMITDANGVILRVNKAFIETTGYSAEEVIGLTPRILQSDLHQAAFYDEMWQAINRTGLWQGEVWDRRKDGQIYPKFLTIVAVKGHDGAVTHYIGTHIDISQIKAAADEIERLAFYDPLTNLPNRRLLQDRLKPALASSHRSGRLGALLFIDLDNFKTLNDTLGHDKGDLLLQQVAHRLSHCVREGDTVARLGGDEFVVVLEDLSEQSFDAATQAETIGKKIQTELSQPYLLAAQDYHSTPSIGATLFNGHRQSIEELLKQADIAMYQAKNAGRNALRFFDPHMQASITARVTLEADLRLALAKNQFELYYQAQIYHNGHIIGAEVLIRWHHPKRGLVPPTDFIPLTEETGLILPIGLWVLQTACAQIKRWESNALTRHLQLAVNVSAHQFRQADFVEQVSEVIRHNAIHPHRLKLELTETLVLDDIDDTVTKMHRLRDIGVCFSMDDFGTGYSSLSSLKKLPLDQLKIDQSFVRDISTDPDDAIIVQTIIAMAKNLGMEVIAEGVETEAQRAFLEQNHCLLYQGYLFSKPVPLEQFEQLLKQRQASI